MSRDILVREFTPISTCGISVLTSYSESNGQYCWLQSLPKYKNTQSGCGWLIAGFVNTKVCEEAYKQMRKKYKLIYQSPVRKNRNSGNKFFFCVFDCKPEGNKTTRS